MGTKTHGVLAPNAKLRSKIVPAPPERATETSSEGSHAQGAPPRMSWARLLKRVFDIDVEHCPNCGGALKIIAAIEDPPVIVKILSHLGLPTHARRAPQLVESIYSKRSEQSKTACQRKPTARLALTSTERRDKEPFMPFSTAFRPLRPLQPWLFHQAQAQTEIDNSPNPAI